MKKFTPRERVLLVVLVILVVFCAYYFLFYTPVSSTFASVNQQNDTLDTQIADADAKIARMKEMNAELEKMKASGLSLKELPAYDNRSNVMSSLSTILADVSQYNVSFSTVNEASGTIRRNISLSYSCRNREASYNILQRINDGPYPCLIKNCTVSGGTGSCSINVELTYFEQK